MNLTDPLCLDNIKACCAASQLAYARPTITDPVSGESVLIQDNGNCTLIAFPGTHDLRDVLRDIDCLRIVTMILGQPCSVHAGFNRAFNSVIGGIIGRLENPFPKILGQGSALFVTGHSKGAAVARRCALQLLQNNCPVLALVTFGEPRGGDARYATICERFLGGRSLRITNAADPVPWMPAWLAGNRQCGPEAWLPPGKTRGEMGSAAVLGRSDDQSSANVAAPEDGRTPRSSGLVLGPRLWPQLLRNSAEIFHAWQFKGLVPLADHHIDNYAARIATLA